MGAYKIAIGWQPNACGFCWAKLSNGSTVSFDRNQPAPPCQGGEPRGVPRRGVKYAQFPVEIRRSRRDECRQTKSSRSQCSELRSMNFISGAAFRL
jgi:hypothetical protein